MTPFAKRINSTPYCILSAMMMTAALFMVLPLLTQLRPTQPGNSNTDSILIFSFSPPQPAPETRDVSEKESPIEKEFAKKEEQPKKARPSFDIPKDSLPGGDTNGIRISIAPSFETVVKIPNPTYRPEEVDQQPVLLRSVPLQYPYRAKRDNIEGWVMLRFVVDKDGSVKEVNVAAAEPTGVFEEVAVKAVKRYRFKPAVKNGETVNCMMAQRIRFDLG